MYWHPRNQWEIAKWPVKKGDQICYLNLEDIRRYIWLLWFKHTGFVKTDWTYSYTRVWGTGYNPVMGNPKRIVWKRGTMKFAWRGHWWYNRVDFTAAMCASPGYQPPDDIHPKPGEWIFSNSYWHIAPDDTLYHEYDLNSPYRIYFYHGGSTSNEEMPEEGWYNSYELLPRQTDPFEQFIPIVPQDTKKTIWQVKSKVPFDASIITNDKVIGAIYSADSMTFYWNSSHTKFSIVRAEPFTGHRMSGTQYTNGARIPIGSAYGFTETGSDNGSRNCCYKTGACYQAMVESVCDNGGELPVDATYLANWMAVNPKGEGETQQAYDERKPGYAPVGDILWGCNASGFELFCKLRGKYDWYFDTQNPFITNAQAQFRFVCDTFICNNDVADSNAPGGYRAPTSYQEFPLPSGTWRWGFHNTMGRIRGMLIRPIEMGTPSRGNYTHRNTRPVINNNPHIQDDGLAGWDSCWLGKPTAVNHPAGTWQENMPELSEFFETIADVKKLEQVHKTGRSAKVSIEGNYIDKIKYANVVIAANSTSDYIECYVMKPPIYDGGYTVLELDKDIKSYAKICHDSRVSSRHDPVSVQYELVEDPQGSSSWMDIWSQITNSDEDILDIIGDYAENKRFSWIAKPQYKLRAELLNEMHELLHGITYEFIGVSLSGGNVQVQVAHECQMSSSAGLTYDWGIALGLVPPVNDWFSYSNTQKFHFNYTDANGRVHYLESRVMTAGIMSIPDLVYTGSGGMSYYDAGDPIWGKASNSSVSYHAAAYRAIGDPRLLLGKSAIVKFTCEDYVEHPYTYGPYIDQSAGGLSSRHYDNYPIPTTVRTVLASLPINGECLVLRPGTMSIGPLVQVYPNMQYYTGGIEAPLVYSGPILLVKNGNSGIIICYDFTLAPDWVWDRETIGCLEPRKALVNDTKPPWPNPVNHYKNPKAYFKYIPEVQMKDEAGNLVFNENGTPKMLPEKWELRIRTESVLLEDKEGSNPVYCQFANEDETFISDWMANRIVDQMYVEFTTAMVETQDAVIVPTGSIVSGSTNTKVWCEHNDLFRVGDIIKFEKVYNMRYTYNILETGKGYIIIQTTKYEDLLIIEGSRVMLASEEPGYDLLNYRLENFYQMKIKIRAKDNNSPIQNVGMWSELVPMTDPERWPLKIRDDYRNNGTII
jgi:hypothetical protein